MHLLDEKLVQRLATSDGTESMTLIKLSNDLFMVVYNSGYGATSHIMHKEALGNYYVNLFKSEKEVVFSLIQGDKK